MTLRLEEKKVYDLGSTSVLTVRSTGSRRVAGTYHGELVIGGKEIKRIQAHDGQLLALYYDGEHILTGGSDGYLIKRTTDGSILSKLEVSSDYIYGIAELHDGYVICDGIGRVIKVNKDLSKHNVIYQYEERWPARDVITVDGKIVVGFYDGLITVLNSNGKKLRDIFRTTGDSVTFLSLYEPLNVILSGFRSGRVSLIYYKGAEFTIRSGRSKRNVFIKPRQPVDLQTVGSVTRRIGIKDERLMVLGGNGVLSFQSLSKLIKAALSTRGTRIVARRTSRLHEYGANGARHEKNDLYTAGLDGYLKLREVHKDE